MKILHVWDVAGVSSILAKYQAEMGHETKVMMLKKNDPMGVASFYNKPYDIRARDFVRKVIKEAANYDVIHVHNISEILPFIKLRYPRKRVIIHHHGFTSAMKKFTKLTHRFADDIFIATEDLQPLFPKAHYIPTPVDTRHFKPDPNVKPTKGNLAFHSKHLDMQKFNEHTFGIDIDIIDRDRHPVQYKDMPYLLRTYSTFYDVKFLPQGLGTVLSKTAYEALACGLTVINSYGNRITNIPWKHCAQHSPSLCLKLYGVKR